MGRTAFCFSGGGSLGAYHVSVALELAEQNLLPKIITVFICKICINFIISYSNKIQTI